jgi:hypothetical protein
VNSCILRLMREAVIFMKKFLRHKQRYIDLLIERGDGRQQQV